MCRFCRLRFWSRTWGLLPLMLAILSPIDYGVLLLYVAVLIGLGVYFSGRQRDTAEFLLAGRSLGWLPLSLSLMATFMAFVSFTGLPGEAYEHGVVPWIVILALWLILPVVAFVAVPLQRGMSAWSLSEYLEHRFDGRVRLLASLIFLGWRLLWLSLMIYAPCRAALIAADWDRPVWMLIVPLGIVTTLYTFLGGMRAAVWSSAIQASAILVGAVIVIVGIWMQIDGGAGRVAEVARGLARMEPARLTFDWSDSWTVWGALPFWIESGLVLYVADQLTVQRMLGAKTANVARNAFLLNLVGLTFLVPALVYAGLCLLAFYYDHPQEMHPRWVANVNNLTRESLRGADGQPLLEENNPAHAVTFENIDQLVAEGRLLKPNSKEPFTDATELIDPQTNRVRIEKLAMRKPTSKGLRGEIIIRRGAAADMLPRFVAQHLSWGAAGVLLVALLGGAMAALSCGASALATVLVGDLHRRFGWGKQWLARRRGKESSQLNAADELQLARPLTLVLGLMVTLLAAILAQGRHLPNVLIPAANACGAPLLAVFLLGMFTRRATAAGALIAAAMGFLLTLGLTAFGQLARQGVVVPSEYAFAETWSTVGGVAFTLALGYAASLVLGRRKSTIELRGLVVGCGELGTRATDETVPLISVPQDEGIRWK